VIKDGPMRIAVSGASECAQMAKGSNRRNIYFCIFIYDLMYAYINLFCIRI